MAEKKLEFPIRPLPSHLNEPLKFLGLGMSQVGLFFLVSIASAFCSQFIPTEWAIWGFPISGFVLFGVPISLFLILRWIAFAMPRGYLRASFDAALRPKKYAPKRPAPADIHYLVLPEGSQRLPKRNPFPQIGSDAKRHFQK